jgi:hypothetical protein
MLLSRRLTYRRALMVVAAAALVTGCAGLEQPTVEQVASTFTGGDPATRCTLLAPATVSALEFAESAACTDAIGPLAPPGGPVLSAEVWGDAAQVHLTGDTMFLTRTSAGWKVAAAGCVPRGDAPYECRVEGP